MCVCSYAQNPGRSTTERGSEVDVPQKYTRAYLFDIVSQVINNRRSIHQVCLLVLEGAIHRKTTVAACQSLECVCVQSNRNIDLIMNVPYSTVEFADRRDRDRSARSLHTS